MPSGISALDELVKRFESLLTRETGTQSVGTAMFGKGFSGLSSSLTGAGDQEGLAQTLTGGVLGGPIGLAASLFSSLFRRETEEAPAFTPYERPGPIAFDYDVSAPAPSVPAIQLQAQSRDSSHVAGDPNSPGGSQAQVVIHVNALDSQSFSARSDEIASAVREALARNHALRDEIWED